MYLKMELRVISTLSLAISLMPAMLPCAAHASGTLKITIPRRSHLTPVQRLNREGVEAVKKHEYEKAATLFYKAYLFDPSDPFTLNNLGYISEMQGELNRARRFYSLAKQQSCTATIDLSNVSQLEGKPMQSAFNDVHDIPMQVNRMNVDAITLLSENRGYEAISLLQKNLSIDKQNPFTLNNLGVAEEMTGDYDSAIQDYVAAARMHSKQIVVITKDRRWRGKSVSAMASASAAKLEDRIKKFSDAEITASMLTMRGVYAINQNDLTTGKDDFLDAYTLNPTSAFTLNNRGYVAEIEGDLETAQDFYEKAQAAEGSNDHVGQATRAVAEGRRLAGVAETSNLMVTSQLRIYTQEQRRRTEPVVLTPRGSVRNQVPKNAPQ